ncbi:MAG: BlaI/MecI/CopY family transcriptional regulator [Alphaproteobacteria bacterium]
MTKIRKPSEAETAILHVLWERQPCLVKTVHDALSATKDVGYTTTLKQIQRLLDKGLVKREPGPGKSFLYSAAVTEEDTKGKLFDRFVETTFSNSVSELVMHALGNGKPSDAEIDEIRKFLDQLDH